MAEKFISFNEAVKILRDELFYPEDRALLFVKRFDKNNDGKLSVAEFTHFKSKIEETKTQVSEKFKEFDSDGNKFVTLEEAATILQKPPFSFPDSDRVRIFLTRFDADGNGKLDINEFAAFYAEAKACTKEEMLAYFDMLDRDKNGVLSPDEVIHVIRDQLGFDEATAKHLIGMFDQNKDGSLDKSEFMKLWANLFGK